MPPSGGAPPRWCDGDADAEHAADRASAPGRPWRDRLRSLAARLDPSAVTWSDFPTQIRSYPPEILTLGRASYRPPLIFGPPEGGHHVEIGAYCSMAWDAEILVDPGAWPADDPGPPDRSRLRVVLGHDIWLTRMAKVLGGVTVGTGAIIANGAVVTEDVRPYAIVAGNPAREVGRRFTDEQVEGLLEVAWWDWPETTVRERYAELCSDDIDGFLARHSWPWPLTGAGPGPACAVRRPAASGGWATGWTAGRTWPGPGGGGPPPPRGDGRRRRAVRRRWGADHGVRRARGSDAARASCPGSRSARTRWCGPTRWCTTTCPRARWWRATRRPWWAAVRRTANDRRRPGRRRARARAAWPAR